VRQPEAGGGDGERDDRDDQRERAAVPVASEPVVEARGVDGSAAADDGEVVLIELSADDPGHAGIVGGRQDQHQQRGQQAGDENCEPGDADAVVLRARWGRLRFVHWATE
jgi:hypothetical protein